MPYVIESPMHTIVVVVDGTADEKAYRVEARRAVKISFIVTRCGRGGGTDGVGG